MNKFNLSFEQVSMECLNNKELVRLKGIKHPLIEKEIDFNAK